MASFLHPLPSVEWTAIQATSLVHSTLLFWQQGTPRSWSASVPGVPGWSFQRSRPLLSSCSHKEFPSLQWRLVLSHHPDQRGLQKKKHLQTSKWYTASHLLPEVMLLVMIGDLSICLLYQAMGLKLRLPIVLPGKQPALPHTVHEPLHEEIRTIAKAAITTKGEGLCLNRTCHVVNKRDGRGFLFWQRDCFLIFRVTSKCVFLFAGSRRQSRIWVWDIFTRV